MNFEKLPKWVQDHIRNLQLQRDSAVNSLNEFLDQDTPGPFKFKEYVYTGEATSCSSKTRYVHARNCEVIHNGVKLGITLADDGLRLQYETEKSITGEVMMQPRSYQQIYLFLPKVDR